MGSCMSFMLCVILILILLIGSVFAMLRLSIRNPENAFNGTIVVNVQNLLERLRAIALLWTFIVAALFLFCRVSPLAGALLVPCLLWVVFAYALSTLFENLTL
jgi:tryptophan-rich sensory protein